MFRGVLGGLGGKGRGFVEDKKPEINRNRNILGIGDLLGREKGKEKPYIYI